MSALEGIRRELESMRISIGELHDLRERVERLEAAGMSSTQVASSTASRTTTQPTPATSANTAKPTASIAKPVTTKS